ncbi:HypC/HybG/HupF family hydrogenase formation chaperone [Nitrosospira sp. Nsp13]|uniref:HypC/HybG/HupF family hydrogenase formation chaperone n=1 Tax=Nitrosospira sp. Nsp13 TaxID=1855332 RepID=UPI0008880674|nr:Hydrogenase maturation protein HypC [Nitrosospira sp. Nsp13]
MCLAIPMKIVQIDGFNALCEAKGVTREVSLYLIQTDPIAIGDFVMVHIGYAIQKICEQEARSAWELHDERMAFEANDA